MATFLTLTRSFVPVTKQRVRPTKPHARNCISTNAHRLSGETVDTAEHVTSRVHARNHNRPQARHATMRRMEPPVSQEPPQPPQPQKQALGTLSCAPVTAVASTETPIQPKTTPQLLLDIRAAQRDARAFQQKVQRATGYDRLPLELRLRGAVREALREMTPTWIALMRDTPVARKLDAANDLWLTARDQLIGQGLKTGLDQTAAAAEAAMRLMSGNVW